MWTYATKAFNATGAMKGYWIGKLLGTLFDFLASIASFKSKEEKTLGGATAEIKTGLAGKGTSGSSGIGDFIESLEKAGETVDGIKDKVESAEKAVNGLTELSKKGLGLTKKKQLRQLANKGSGYCMNFKNGTGSDRWVVQRECNDSEDNRWWILKTDDEKFQFQNENKSDMYIDDGTQNDEKNF